MLERKSLFTLSSAGRQKHTYNAAEVYVHPEGNNRPNSILIHKQIPVHDPIGFKQRQVK